MPAKIGKYEIQEVIGQGGMGIVYRGTDPHLSRSVAIKMVMGNFDDQPDYLKRFFREAQSTGSLQHPNIVTVYELGDHEGSPYLVMEYLEGEPLDKIINKRRPLHLLQKLDILLGLCHGLSFAHKRGIVHRDIKPANVITLKDGGVKIVDFGIAHIGDRSVTRTGQIVGSLSYMSPEQVSGKLVDHRSDVFSAAVVLFHLVAYALPFESTSTAATLLSILNEAPRPLKDFLASYPPELERILLLALEKDRDKRYQSVDEFALDITQLHSQIKQELIARRIEDASLLVENADLLGAREKLLKVLELDKHHTEANRMLQEVRLRIQAQAVDQLHSAVTLNWTTNDLLTALRETENALLAFPAEPHLLELKQEVEKQLAEEHSSAPSTQVADGRDGTEMPPSSSALESDVSRTPRGETGESGSGERPIAPVSGEVSGARSESGAGTLAGWSEKTLRAFEKELAPFIGPLARVLVRKNAVKTQDPEQLYMLLANTLEQESDRQAFLARKAVFGKEWKMPGSTGDRKTPATGPATPAAQSMELSPEALEQASRMLAAYVGPISKVLVRKESRHTTTLKGLYQRLAGHIDDPDARAKFLREARA
jgi:serine/threonine protein kinase